MNNRLAIASVVLVVLLGLALWKLNARDAEVETKPKAEVEIPKLERDKIEELELSAPERETVKLVKQGDEWKMVQPVEATADQSAVSTALDKLAELEVTGVAATNDKNHDRLEVNKEKGTHVIARGGGKVLLDAYIGRYQTGNSMLRLEGQHDVATVAGSIRFAFTKYAREWRDRKISALESDDVSEVRFESSKGNFTFRKSGDSWQQVTGKGEKPIDKLDTAKVGSLVGTAAKLSAVDFAAPDVTAEQASVGDAPEGTVTLTLTSDAGVEQVIYRLGKKVENNIYLAKQGDDRIFLVSSWVGGRLMPAPEDFVKKEEAAAPPGGPPHGDLSALMQAPPGSPQNPIKVEPIKVETKEAKKATPPPAKKGPAPAPH